jgi:hypothetical protein
MSVSSCPIPACEWVSACNAAQYVPVKESETSLATLCFSAAVGVCHSRSLYYILHHRLDSILEPKKKLPSRCIIRHTHSFSPASPSQPALQLFPLPASHSPH